METITIRPHHALRVPKVTFHPRDCFGAEAPAGNWRNFRKSGVTTFVDPQTIAFEDAPLFRGLRAVMLEGERWENTAFYRSVAKNVSEINPLWGARSAEAFLRRLYEDIPALIRSISRNGLLSQKQMLAVDETADADLAVFRQGRYYDRTDEYNEIKVGIDRRGRIVLLEGQHRMAAARLLQIDVCVVVVYRHDDWRRIRSLVETNAVEGRGVVIDHPDLSHLALPEQEVFSVVRDTALADIDVGLRLSGGNSQRASEVSRVPKKYLTRADYIARTKAIGTGHWSNAERRWVYHSAAVGLAQVVSPSSPDKVLEMGTMGVNIVPGSHTIDYADSWQFEGKQPTYTHDGRKTPWPVASDAYELFIGLRVFHHLSPNQEGAFKEAKRVAKNLIIVTPVAYDKMPGSKGIPLDKWIAWNDGVPPTAIMEFNEEFGNLYFWNASALGRPS